MQMKHVLVLQFFAAAILGASATARSAEAREKTTSSAPRNATYFEVGGPGILYSLNYERFILPQFSVRAGVSLFGLHENTTGDTLGVFAVPITGQYLVGKGSHHLELGMGILTGVMWSDLNSYQKTESFGLIAATATIGYRYQPPRQGFLFRVALTPLYGGSRFEPLGLPVTPWGSISAGYAF